ncbi:hypothetical protein MESS4_430129 [Mesorhizobium sp. STM 4661]|nr:hypothetical protein MESS4_430129 [Mesorhizobium sp. STM 4661]
MLNLLTVSLYCFEQGSTRFVSGVRLGGWDLTQAVLLMLGRCVIRHPAADALACCWSAVATLLRCRQKRQ